VSTVVVHGGCGNPRGDSIAGEEDYHGALRAAVAAADAVLDRGGPALDAAQAAVESLEDAPQFNAGRGSVLTADGSVEMDAALMNGPDRRAGAVAAVSTPRHAVALARHVMDETPHLLMAGPGAERLAAGAGIEQMGADWFVTDRQRERWWKARGTVGAVVLDDDGFLAAATSTGGTTGQLSGRVGDSPLIGAGTWADERVAVSATGDGEQIIRAAAAHRVAALVELGGLSLEEACRQVVDSIEGEAGLIAVDGHGNVAMPFNTRVMHRAVRIADAAVETGVWTPKGA
jgi:isoaspartyl peptidase/L-asparaginase-like protein (Ntn-hydrolase superfamily)